MPNLEISADQYRNGIAHRKASFIENLNPNLTTITSSRKNSHGSAPQPVKEEILYRSKSLQLSEYTFSDAAGNQKSTEVIHKVLNDESSPMDDSNDLCCHGAATQATEGILSIAILKRHILCDCLILTKRYRPSLKSFVLEFPAKIVEHGRTGGGDSDVESDHSSDIGDAAMKDVEDNTGYKSTQVKWVSPETAIDPELCDNKLKLVSLIIDGDDPIRNNFFTNNTCTSGSGSDDEGNQEGSHTCSTQCLDDVEVIPVPINGLLDRLNVYSRSGVIIDSRVYAFAIGLKKGEKLAQSVVKPENIEMAI